MTELDLTSKHETEADTWEHAGLIVRIVGETEGGYADPREMTQLGVMVFDRDLEYKLGDEQITWPDEFLIDCPACEGTGEHEPVEPQPADQPDITDCPRCDGDGEIVATAEQWARETFTDAVGPILFLHFQDYRYYGNVTVDPAPGDATDANGVIYATRKTLDETGAPEDSIERQLRGEVEEYGAWLRGEVYGFIVEDPETGETLESVWGFLGNDSFEKEDGYLRADANATAEGCRENIEREKAERAHWAARDVETLA